MNTYAHCLALTALLTAAHLTASGCGDEGSEAAGAEVEQGAHAAESETDGEVSEPEEGGDDSGETAGPPIGTTWAIDVSQATWVTPEDVEDLVELMTADYPALLGISGADSTTVNAMLAIGDATGQLMCNRTVEVIGLTVDDDGVLTFSSESFSLANGMTMADMTLTAAIDAETGSITSLDARCHVVMSSIPADLLPLGEGQTACDMTEGLGMPCILCPSEPATGGVPDCIEVQVTGFRGNVLTEINLVPITEADCHPECGDNSEDCDTSGWSL